MGSLLTLLLLNLPTIITAAKDISAIVSAAMAAEKIFELIVAKYPQLVNLIEQIGSHLPFLPGTTSHEQHLGNVTSAILGLNGWNQAQLQQWWSRASSISDA